MPTYKDIEDKTKAVNDLIENRFPRVKDIMSDRDSGIFEGMKYELTHRPCGGWLTATDKHLRKYERILGISRKGNKSK